jgi:Lon protease-like protein
VTTHSLPLFPLPLVLFPGTTLPLHIFEPRYRELLADCRRGDGRFGIVLTTGGEELALPAGLVGCEAELREVQMLPDGRANVLVHGTRRFALERFADEAHLYHVAVVSDYDDEPGDASAELEDAAERVRATFTRVARAARTIADDDAPLPELPDDPALVAFQIASLVDFDRAERQALLASRSPLARLRAVDALLGRAIEGVEDRAATHARARRNGHGPRGAFGAA